MEQKPWGENPGDAQKQPEIILSPPVTANTETGSTKRCPICANVNPAVSIYCFKCGLKLPEYVIPDKKICTGCQTPNAASAQYCYKCGLQLPEKAGSVSVMRYGGFWVRLLASLIDSMLLGVLTSIITTPFLLSYMGQFSDSSSSFATDGTVDSSFWTLYFILVAATFIVQMAYQTIAVGKWGRTVGKVALGLKVVKPDGSRVSYWRALGRSLAYYLNQITFGLTYLMIAFTHKKRGLHDYIADTVVIKTN
jgi:uncharacterized RDD family membrane protein YckC